MSRLDEVRTLAALDPARSGDPNRAIVSSAVNRACLVLLSAHLEGFLEDLAVEAIDFVAASGVDVMRLPLLLRALHAESHLSRLEQSKDRNVRAPMIEVLFLSESALWAGGTSLVPSMLRAKVVCAEMNNPGSRDVHTFLRYLGVDFRDQLKATGSLSVLSRIDGLVSKRNQVAHGEVSATATHMDIDAYIAVVNDLCVRADAEVGRSVQQICGLAALPW